MTAAWERRLGRALLVMGALGLTMCLAGFLLLGIAQQRAEVALLRQLDLATASLTVTADGLVVAGDALTRAGITLVSTQRLLAEVGTGLGTAREATDRVAGVVGQEVPATLRSVRTGLAAAEQGARLVDSTLDTINRFIPGARPAEPAPPLAPSIAAVATSLDDLNAPLVAIEKDLRATADTLTSTRAQLAAMERNLGELGDTITSARTVITRYQVLVDDLRREVARLRAALPGWLSLLRWGLAALLLPVGFTQVGLLVQGWRLTRPVPQA
ncbi:MAG: hypothetical protein IT340_07300 [Chloroflexi bacterium]|nr:hypothetical protein [Chloroflexota bacterium]